MIILTISIDLGIKHLPHPATHMSSRYSERKDWKNLTEVFYTKM